MKRLATFQAKLATLIKKLSLTKEELVALLIREIRVSRFDPDKDDSPADPDVFKVKM